MSIIRLSAGLSSAIALLSAGALAQDGVLIVGVGAVPEYEGSADQQILPFVAGRYEVDGRTLILDGLSLRADLMRSSQWEAGPLLSYTFGRDDEIDGPVGTLPVINDAVEAGGYVARNLTLGEDAGTAVQLSLRATHDISGVHDGWIVTPAIGGQRQLSPRWSLAGDLSASFVSDDYAETYFGVSPGSALDPFEAKGGLKDVGVSVTWTWAATESWGLTGYSGYKRLVGDAADSPVVKDAGDANQVTVFLGVTTEF